MWTSYICDIRILNGRVSFQPNEHGIDSLKWFTMQKKTVCSRFSSTCVEQFECYNIILYWYCVLDTCIYSRKPIPKLYQKFIDKYRLSSHSLSIETGRYHAIAKSDRKCPECKNDIEDEFNFVLKCPSYYTLKNSFIKPYFHKKLSNWFNSSTRKM
jgi:hypothetical protein